MATILGDTWIQTALGPKRPADLTTMPFEALVDGFKHQTVSLELAETKGEVYQIETNRGIHINATAEQQFLVVSKKNTTWTAAKDLKDKDKLAMTSQIGMEWSGPGTFNEGYMLGSLLGDGSIVKNSAILSVWDKDEGSDAIRGAMDKMGIFKQGTNWCYVGTRKMHIRPSHAVFKLAATYGMVHNHKTPDERIHKTSSQFHRGFISGFFDTDGSVQGNFTRGFSVRVSQVTLEHLYITQLMLARLGIASTIYFRKPAEKRMMPTNKGDGSSALYDCKDSYELIICRSADWTRFANVVGFINPRKQARLQDFMAQRAPNGDDFNVKVKKIKIMDSNTTPTSYTFSRAGDYTFDANGLKSHISVRTAE